MIRLYVELEQLRFSNEFDFVLNIDKSVNEYETQVPGMLIQPYVENAIWHGLMNLDKNKKGELRIDIVSDGERLNITIEDNGVGRETAQKYGNETQHGPVGMRLTEERLKMINKLEGFEDSKVVVTDLYDEQHQPSGTRVEISIPIE